MSLFEELGVEYKEVDGILYPLLSVDEADYSSDNVRLIYGTTDLFQDVKRVYHREFDDAVKEYNSRQKR